MAKLSRLIYYTFRYFRTILVNEIAVKLSIKKIVLAIDCTKLTIQLLSNVAQGKAAHLSSELVYKCFL